jgi:hypothetical protein
MGLKPTMRMARALACGLSLLWVSIGALAAQATKTDQASTPLTFEIPKGATTLEGVPSVRVDLSAESSTRRVLGKDEAARNKLNIKVKNGQFFWASHENEPLSLQRSGEFTFLSSTPGNYISMRRVNDKITYVAHLDDKGRYITYFGELRIVLGK